jgi:hypothetical protein
MLRMLLMSRDVLGDHGVLLRQGAWVIASAYWRRRFMRCYRWGCRFRAGMVDRYRGGGE